MRCLDGFLKTTDRSLSKLQEIEKNREAWLVAVHGVTKSWTQLREETTKAESGGGDLVAKSLSDSL